MKKIKILLIEDDQISAKYICDFLSDCDFEVAYTDNVTDGIASIKQHDHNLLLLDLNLPDFSGLDLLKDIKNKYSLPIIVVSAYNDTKTKVQAFRYGASDYMVKPLDLEELEARIWALLGRFSKLEKVLETKTFQIKDDFVFFKGQPLDLTSIEFEIFFILIENQNQTISRELLADSLSSISSHRSLDQHIKNIRKKINDDASKSKYLKTEYGVGYKLVNMVES
ncbi:MAG: response regulator transcription factor [Epsilonproteobacteria bacterium]|nr:response regulator transcription factor [Campylobacterota bacterium]